MTRKDYVQLSAGFGRVLADCRDMSQALAAWDCVVMVADVLQADNVRFDRARFLAAVRVSEETHKALKGLV
jgi:hypothetical protein